MSQTPGLEAQINDLVRRDRGRLLAGLIRALGDFQLAEECLQEALISAVSHWARAGLPDNPQGWLMRVAQRKAIDRLRREGALRRKAAEIAVLAVSEASVESAHEIPDERLRLIFTCCHPALEPKTRVALTLRLIGGLSTEEIARAYLDKTPAMAARLTRAKAKIRDAKIPYQVPEGPDLAPRLASVLDVIYLIFNEGYAATEGDGQLRVDLCDEALFLARMIAQMCPDQPEAEGLLALILLTHARRAARQSKAGVYVPLAAQDRSLWDKDMIGEGADLVEATLKRGQVGPFQLQAAIAALHCEGADARGTDWPQIVALYRVYARIDANPVVALNLAVALAKVEGAEVGLTALDTLRAELETYQPYHASRAALLVEVNNTSLARDAFDRAIELSKVSSERQFLTARRDQLGKA